VNLDLETFKIMQGLRRGINSTPLADLHLFKNGKEIEFKPEIIEDFEMTGLANVDFIESEFYLKGFDDKGGRP